MIKEYKTNLIYGNRYEDDILISFIIPTYNRLNTLKETVDSIIPNDKIKYEIIVVDNSDYKDTGNTREYFSTQNIKHLSYYVNEKNYGMVDNWNVGLLQSNGKYVAYIHDDDVIDKNYFSVISELLLNKLKGKKIGFIKAKFDNFSNISEIRSNDNLTYGYNEILKIESILDGIGATFAPTCGLLFNREALSKVGGFNSLYHPCADHIIGFDILNTGYKGYVTKDIIGHYRWGINESLKKETLIGTVEKNYVIREHFYSNNFLYKIYGCLFRKLYYTRDVKNYLLHAKRFHQSISLEEMAQRKEFYISNILIYKVCNIINRVFVKFFKVIIKGICQYFR